MIPTKPTLAAYQLSESDIAQITRLKSILSWSYIFGMVIGLVSGFLVGGLLLPPSGALVGAIVFFIGGGVLGAESEGWIARNLDSRVQRYEAFVAALSAYDIAVREAQERELRARSEFWQTLSGHRFEVELAALFERDGYKVRRTPGSHASTLAKNDPLLLASNDPA